jgi:hypothetical protein
MTVGVLLEDWKTGMTGEEWNEGLVYYTNILIY